MSMFEPKETIPLIDLYDSCDGPNEVVIPCYRFEIGTYIDRDCFHIFKWEGNRKTTRGVILFEKEMDRIVEAYLAYKASK